MAKRKPGPGGPDEPHNIPIRIYGTIAADPEYQEMLRDMRALIRSAIDRGVIPYKPRKKGKKARRSKKRPQGSTAP
jgi:hypothetical protein